MRRLLLALGGAVLAGTYARVVMAERAQRRDTEELPSRADAIVVFGGQCYERGPAIEVCDRLNHAISLWNQSVAPVVLLSGGWDGEVDEVAVMRAYAVRNGVPASATKEARPGDNTRQTIGCLEPGKTYVAVSSAYHAHRISAEARRQGKHVIVDCAPDSIEVRNHRVRRVRRISEVVGCLVYASPEPLVKPARRAVGRLRHSIPGLFTPQQKQRPDPPPKLHVPPGHPYSPIPSAEDIARTADTDDEGIHPIPGVDLRVDQQWALLKALLPLYPEVAELLQTGKRFTLDNTMFSGADAVFMALMLKHLRPARLIEVGSGHSSALITEAAPATHATFIDPDPRRVRQVVGEDAEVIAQPVQDIDPAIFTTLQPGDVLAIDSSHVMRAGSDVHHLLFTVLPMLPPGIHIHVHDIFFPFEYPRIWLDDGVAFSEAYAVRALLTNVESPFIELWNHLLIRDDRAWFEQNMPLTLSAPFRTGGLWLCT